MKNTLLAIISFLAYILPAGAQTLYSTTYHGGNDGNGTIGKFDVATNTLTVIKTFESAGQSPAYTNLIQASDGKFYGLALQGGAHDMGTIFSFDPSSFTYKQLKEFNGTDGSNPYGSLIQATDGKLYGMTTAGGTNDNGVIFSFDQSTSTYTKLMDFGNTVGTYPNGSLMQASDGKLYGMTADGGSAGLGALFSFDPSTSAYTKLRDFDGTFIGSNPVGSLIEATSGALYGITSTGGTNNQGVIFAFYPSASLMVKEKDLDGTNGGHPYGTLFQASDGKFYGLTTSGGANNAGVIFSYDHAGATYINLKDFGGTDGATPYGNLIKASNGKLYGMTAAGGSNGNGVIFSFDAASSVYTKVKDFITTDGIDPKGSLFQATNGKLYGMTSGGGSIYGIGGVIFSLDPSSLDYQKVDLGSTKNGSHFLASLLQATDGKLYGMTDNGGINNFGVIYSFDPATSTYTKLVDFDSTNGANPGANFIQVGSSLIQASNGKLYGMTNAGGSSNLGVIFSFDPTSSVLTKLIDFDATIGSRPYGSLMQASDGKLYGMTLGGGSNNDGVIFSFDPSSSTYTKLKDFDGTNGSFPAGNLIQATDHLLYGLTVGGGSNNTGVIFSFDPSSSTYTKLKDFDNIPGLTQNGSLVQATDEKLYGMIAEGGTNQFGAIFSYDPPSSTYTVVKNFDLIDGIQPQCTLFQASDGKLYGMTYQGGTGGNVGGSIFSLDPSTLVFAKLVDYNGDNGANPNFNSAFIELSSGTLPVALISFTGKNNGSSNQLSWKVEQEQNLDYYELQRSNDGQNFKAVSHIKALESETYTYDDAISPTSSIYYYRLKSVDKDGRSIYSPVIKITTALKDFVVVNPNPFTDKLVVNIELLVQDKATLIITDLNGKQLYKQSRLLSAGTSAIEINVTSRLAKGTYLLTIISSQLTQSIKVVKAD